MRDGKGVTVGDGVIVGDGACGLSCFNAKGSETANNNIPKTIIVTITRKRQCFHEQNSEPILYFEPVLTFTASGVKGFSSSDSSSDWRLSSSGFKRGTACL